ncbi:MAG: hypothetical protein Q7T55_08295 [Solirubrobacteraceae bacterium]|nr:hypothetical protein [Solirubrobacteraceae bacterium]
MTATERSLSVLAALLVIISVALLVMGENVLGATSLLLGGAFYAYATTPHDGDEHVR